MSREGSIRLAQEWFDSGGFFEDLSRRVAIRTSSQGPDPGPALRAYLTDEILPAVGSIGVSGDVYENPDAANHPIFVGRRIESADLPTVVMYAHGDTVAGQEEGWAEGLAPWRLTRRDGRLYGRGTADNKGQFTVNLGALRALLEVRGRFGFNLTVLVETGEEVGSPGLEAFCRAHADSLLRGDLLIASDGPRILGDTPTVFLGSRGNQPILLSLDLREGGRHSGNWGGILRNPAIILAQALSTVTDARGQIQIPEWRPPMPDVVRSMLKDVEIAADDNWGEKTLSAAERVFAWNSFEILAMEAGTPRHPVNAIPPSAKAWCQLRYVVGTDREDIIPGLRRHLDRHGFDSINVEPGHDAFPASQLDPEDRWVDWVIDSIACTTGVAPVVLPSTGGSLPNATFAETLGLKTIWIPHSYPGCSQHAPNEHLPEANVRSGLAMMAGIFWDLGELDR
jgi:acetylornithine deacetylase/succinyl-diaminopimelate desuccinylase-like protein